MEEGDLFSDLFFFYVLIFSMIHAYPYLMLHAYRFAKPTAILHRFSIGVQQWRGFEGVWMEDGRRLDGGLQEFKLTLAVVFDPLGGERVK